MAKAQHILAIDIGGSHVKGTILDKRGRFINAYERMVTPPEAGPKEIMAVILKIVSKLDSFDFISVGFPGYVKNGVVMTAPNLSTEKWHGYKLQKHLEKKLGKPAQAVNDADMQGLGVVKGKGLEMVVTLGTGLGTALLFNGKLLPHLEVSHHPISNQKDYDVYIGNVTMKKIGPEKWNQRMKYVLDVLKTVFNYDKLYLGGGNASKLKIELDKNIKLINNRDGIKGGARLWFPIYNDQ